LQAKPRVPWRLGLGARLAKPGRGAAVGLCCMADTNDSYDPDRPSTCTRVTTRRCHARVRSIHWPHQYTPIIYITARQHDAVQQTW